MMRLPLAFVVLVAAGSLAACPGKKGSTTGTSSGSGSSTVPLAKKFSLAWGIQQAGTSAEIFLQTTDETGKQVSHPIGTFKGACEAKAPAPEMKALIGMLCKDGGTGTELHAVVQGASIIILKLHWDEGVTADPMAREELTRIAIPSGAAVEAG